MRDALKGLYEDAPRIYQKDQAFAETITRLYKRVEAQQATSLNAMASLTNPMMQPVATIGDDSAVAALGLPADPMDPFGTMNLALGADDTAAGMGFPGLDLDPTVGGMSLLGTSGGGTTDEDIFADLMNSGGFELDGFD